MGFVQSCNIRRRIGLLSRMRSLKIESRQSREGSHMLLDYSGINGYDTCLSSAALGSGCEDKDCCVVDVWKQKNKDSSYKQIRSITDLSRLVFGAWAGASIARPDHSAFRKTRASDRQFHRFTSLAELRTVCQCGVMRTDKKRRRVSKGRKRTTFEISQDVVCTGQRLTA